MNQPPVNSSIMGQQRQQGVVLLIALIALVALTLTGLSLVRSITATTAIAGNLTFRQGTLHGSDGAVKAAISKIMGDLSYKATSTSDPTHYHDAGNYYFSVAGPTEYTTAHPAACGVNELACTKRNGIPNRLMMQNTGGGRCGNASDATSFNTNYALTNFDAVTGSCTIIVVERLCTVDGAPDTSKCVQLSSAAGQNKDGYDQSHGGDSRESDLLPSATQTALRVTIRVDGARGTTTYVQSIMAI